MGNNIQKSNDNVLNYNQEASINLHKFPKNCSKDDVNSIFKKYNFFYRGRNAKGIFNNTLKPLIIKSDKVIISHLRGLMWHQSDLIEPIAWY